MDQNPYRFIELSYYFAIASSLIILVSLLSGLLGWDFLSNIVWLGLITSGIGFFFAVAGRKDFSGEGGVPASHAMKSRVGFRINLGVLAMMVFIVVFYVLFALRRF